MPQDSIYKGGTGVMMQDMQTPEPKVTSDPLTAEMVDPNWTAEQVKEYWGHKEARRWLSTATAEAEAARSARDRARELRVTPEEAQREAIVEVVTRTPAERAMRLAKKEARKEKRYLGEDPSRKGRKSAAAEARTEMETRREVMDRVREKRRQQRQIRSGGTATAAAPSTKSQQESTSGLAERPKLYPLTPELE